MKLNNKIMGLSLLLGSALTQNLQALELDASYTTLSSTANAATLTVSISNNSLIALDQLSLEASGVSISTPATLNVGALPIGGTVNLTVNADSAEGYVLLNGQAVDANGQTVDVNAMALEVTP